MGPTGKTEGPGARADPRVLLDRCFEDGPEHFPAFFRRIKPALYGPILKYRDFLPRGGVPAAEEAARDGLSDLLAALIKRGAADRYEAARECFYDIWALVGKQDLLEKYRLDGRDGAGIFNGLRRVASNHVYSMVVKTEPEMSRLFTRLRGILEREPEFASFPDGDEDWWGLSGWRNPEQFRGPPEDLKSLLSGVDPVARIPRRPGARKASAVISSRALKDLAVAIYEALLKTLTDSGLIRAVGLKLPIIDAGFVPLEIPIGDGDEEDEPVAVSPGARRNPDQGWRTAAEEFAGSLTPRQWEVFRLYWLEERTLVETGSALVISKSLVKQESDRVMRRLLEAAASDTREDCDYFIGALRDLAVEKSADRPFSKSGGKR